MHCLWEIIDNSVDEALAGVCSHIIVTLHSDGSVEVADNGRGIPVDIEPKTKLTGVEVVLTKLHAGAKFGNSSYGASGGLHGVGSSVVNALSSRLDVEVDLMAKPITCHSIRSSGCIYRRRSGASVAGRAVQAHAQEPSDRTRDHWQGQSEDHRYPHPLLG